MAGEHDVGWFGLVLPGSPGTMTINISSGEMWVLISAHWALLRVPQVAVHGYSLRSEHPHPRVLHCQADPRFC